MNALWAFLFTVCILGAVILGCVLLITFLEDDFSDSETLPTLPSGVSESEWSATGTEN